MRNTDYLRLNEANCRDCYKCIRNCPVKSISFASNQAQILHDECILCGNCYVVCPQNAKEVRLDFRDARAAIDRGAKLVASVAPSFIAGFEAAGIEDVRKALTALGFTAIEETAIGAQFVSMEYEKMLCAADRNVLISSCCPAVNTLIQKYYPDLLDLLAGVVSPMRAHARSLRERYPDAKIVFIGPCIAKKKEAQESDEVDFALTFDEITQWMDEANVKMPMGEERQDAPITARLYPVSGGIVRTFDLCGYDSVAIDGVENCMAALEELRTERPQKVFLELSACEGSCIGGPVLRGRDARRIDGALRVRRYAGKEKTPIALPKNLHTSYARSKVLRVQPGGDAIQSVLDKMGKTTREKELNCGCCGYPTCRDKAIAVCQGKAEIEMCLPYLKEKAESFSDQIISNTPNAILVMDENLIVQQVNRAAVRLLKLKSANDALHAPVVRLLDPTDYLIAIQRAAPMTVKRHYIAEYEVYVDETIAYDRQYRILISIMRDITESERRHEKEQALREKTATVAEDVIEKQMRVVQEIASLLGETTAETKVALTKLKDAMQND